MKTKGIFVLALVFLAALFTAIVWGCTDPDPEMADYPYELGRYEGLDSETEWQILKDFRDFYNTPDATYKITVNDMYIDRYYGTYKGCVVFHMDAPGKWDYPAESKYYDIDGIIFSCQYYQDPFVWKGGDFCRLPEAYNLGLLTLDDIRTIAVYFNYGGEE